MFEHAGAQLARAGGDAPGRQVPRDARASSRRSTTCSPPGGARSAPKAAEFVRAFEARYGREPTALELDRLQRQAAMITRPRKSHDGETLEQRLDRWEAQLQAELSIGLDKVAADVLALADQANWRRRRSTRTRSCEIAIADVQAKKASWTEADLVRAINDALPDYLGGLDGSGCRRADRRAGPRGDRAALRVADRRTARRPSRCPTSCAWPTAAPPTSAPGEHLYATETHVRSERALRAAAVERTAARVTPELAAAFLDELGESGIELGADQAAAVRGVLTSGADVESLVGPAGHRQELRARHARPRLDRPHPLGRRAAPGVRAGHLARSPPTSCTAKGSTARNIAQWRAVQQRLADGRAVRRRRAVATRGRVTWSWSTSPR